MIKVKAKVFCSKSILNRNVCSFKRGSFQNGCLNFIQTKNSLVFKAIFFYNCSFIPKFLWMKAILVRLDQVRIAKFWITHLNGKSHLISSVNSWVKPPSKPWTHFMWIESVEWLNWTQSETLSGRPENKNINKRLKKTTFKRLKSYRIGLTIL